MMLGSSFVKLIAGVAGPNPVHRALSVLCVFVVGEAHAQCEKWTSPFGPGDVFNLPVRALTQWDPDGPGGEPPRLVAGGTFTAGVGGAVIRSIAQWDGIAWTAFGSGFNGSVNALAEWDPDGDGPIPARLVAGGGFTATGGIPVARVAYWDGVMWNPLGAGVPATVNAFAVWDPDGPGPLSERLIVGGAFSTAGGQRVNNVAAWDGTSWSPLAAGFNGTVLALTTWDPDGPGPSSSMLVAGGEFTQAGALIVNCIAAWDGESWLAFGAGMSGAIHSLACWDADGAGLKPPELVAGGEFLRAGGTTMNRIARWSGSQWQGIGGGVNNTVSAMTVWDSDGTEETPPDLVVAGSFTTAGGATANRIARWGGDSWQQIASGFQGLVSALALWDDDGGGPGPTTLLSGGSMDMADGIAVGKLARWHQSRWLPFGSGPNGAVESAVLWDVDGSGPLPARLMVGGRFTAAGHSPAARVAAWDGSVWSPLAEGFNGVVLALASWDRDGAGPSGPLLIAAGEFTTSGQQAVNHIAQWDGSGWQPLGSGLDGTARALEVWDPDGGGPALPLLVAGGDFIDAGGIPVGRVAAWDGTTWQKIGSGVGASVHALLSWDTDGAGPAPPLLIAGGTFSSAGGLTAHRVASWNGLSWSSLGIGTQGPEVNALCAWDPDGAGPRASALIAGGVFQLPSGFGAVNLAAWDGEEWSQLGSSLTGLSPVVYSLRSWEPDATSTAPAVLVAGGSFSGLTNIAKWDGIAWSPFAGGFNGTVRALCQFDRDGAGSGRADLIAGGAFSLTGLLPVPGVAAWLEDTAPAITTHPESVSVPLHGEATFRAAGTGTSPSYWWLRETPVGSGLFIYMADGVSPSGSVISGAMSPTLRIAGVSAADATRYRVQVYNPCGEETSEPVALTVLLCPADLNGDGVIDFGDYLEFLNLYDALDPRVDFNQDGVIDFGDYLEFLNHYDAGC